MTFEIGAITTDAKFVSSVFEMLTDDLKNSRELTIEKLEGRGRLHQVFARAVTLIQPVL